MTYDRFGVALYVPAYDVERLTDLAAFDREFAFIEKHIRVDKAYLETYRSGHEVDEKKILALKDHFRKKGIRTSGGITPNERSDSPWDFSSVCYSDPARLDRLRAVAASTARLFDEIILDDFFFDNCRCRACVAAKGDASWTEFRTRRLAEAARSVFIDPAKAANPRVKLIVKFPNWYEHYRGTGYNLEAHRSLFDFVYTGTETRNPERTQQNLPRYASHFLMRFLSAAAPGRNAGGWFDSFDCAYNPNSYLEQALLTLLARPPEVTLFCLSLLLGRDRLFVPLAGFAFDRADRFLGRLGNPIGISCYRPYRATGEDYLHGRLGMLGLPLAPAPEIAAGTGPVLLTRGAAADPGIVAAIAGLLEAGRTVAVTSGLVAALADRGFKDLAEIEVTGNRLSVSEFARGTFHSSFEEYAYSRKPIVVPEVRFNTNDVRQLVVAFSDRRVVPILLESRYAGGRLLMLTVPDDDGDLEELPRPVLDRLRASLMPDFPVRLGAPAGVGLFPYDNGTFVVVSFLSRHQPIELSLAGEKTILEDLESGETLNGLSGDGRTTIKLTLLAAQTRVFAMRIDS